MSKASKVFGDWYSGCNHLQRIKHKDSGKDLTDLDWFLLLADRYDYKMKPYANQYVKPNFGYHEGTLQVAKQCQEALRQGVSRQELTRYLKEGVRVVY